MNIQFRYANQITVGDEVLVPQYHELKTAKVIKISSFIMEGNKYF